MYPWVEFCLCLIDHPLTALNQLQNPMDFVAGFGGIIGSRLGITLISFPLMAVQWPMWKVGIKNLLSLQRFSTHSTNCTAALLPTVLWWPQHECSSERLFFFFKLLQRRRKWLPTPVFLPGEFHGQRSQAEYSPWGRKELDMTEQLTLSSAFTYFFTYYLPITATQLGKVLSP